MIGNELEKRINSMEFEVSLWKKVKLAPEGSDCPYINATVDDSDPLFPYIIVSGYNEANGKEETYRLAGWVYGTQEGGRKEMIEEYEATGVSPALSPEMVVCDIIFCHIINRKADIADAKDELAGKTRKSKDSVYHTFWQE